MRGRRLRWGLALAGLTILFACLIVLRQQRDRVTVENFDRIRNGMSRAEVEAILGPAGDYTTGPLDFESYFGVGCVETREWWSDRQIVTVCFGPSGHVEMKARHRAARMKQTAFENLVWRAKRQWNRWFPEQE